MPAFNVNWNKLNTHIKYVFLCSFASILAKQSQLTTLTSYPFKEYTLSISRQFM